MQHEITKSHPLLDEKGVLTEPGYARSPLLIYDRSAVKAHPCGSRNGITTISATAPSAWR